MRSLHEPFHINCWDAVDYYVYEILVIIYVLPQSLTALLRFGGFDLMPNICL